MSSRIEPDELIFARLRELLPDSVGVEVRQSKVRSGWEVRFHDKTRNLAMDNCIGSHEFYDMIELDGTGWDACGVHGAEAMERTIAMSLDPQYQDKPHRIPAPCSEYQLNKRGECWCRWVVDKFTDALERRHTPEQEYAIREKIAEALVRHEESRRRQYDKIDEEI